MKTTPDNYFRTYDPEVGRYTQSDPIGLGGEVNTYSYTSNNSISSIDPLGLDAWTFNFSINIPFYGGATVGFVEYTGPRVQNRDFGLIATISKHYDGGGLIKAGVGGSYTSGCRQNFDGIGAEISVGLLRGSAKIGVDSGGSAQGRLLSERMAHSTKVCSGLRLHILRMVGAANLTESVLPSHRNVITADPNKP